MNCDSRKEDAAATDMIRLTESLMPPIIQMIGRFGTLPKVRSAFCSRDPISLFVTAGQTVDERKRLYWI